MYITPEFVVSLIITGVVLACYVCAMVAVDVKIMDYLKPGPGEDLCILILILFQISLPICIIYIIFGQEAEPVCECCKEVCECLIQKNAT